MRVAKEERIRKETALEALEAALKQRGLLRRPRRGTAGWKAIEQAICWWKGDDSWLDLPRKVQDVDLRTATAWRTYRQKGVGVMSKDVDQELLAVWTESLYYLISNDKDDENSTYGSNESSHQTRGSTDQPNKRRRTKRQNRLEPQENLENNSNMNQNNNNNNQWGYVKSEESESFDENNGFTFENHFHQQIPPTTSSSPSSFAFSSSSSSQQGGYNSMYPTLNSVVVENGELCEVKSNSSFPPPSCGSSFYRNNNAAEEPSNFTTSSSSSSNHYDEPSSLLRRERNGSSDERALLTDNFLSTSPIKDVVFTTYRDSNQTNSSNNNNSNSSSSNNRMITEPNHQSTEIVATEDGDDLDGIDFDMFCDSITSISPRNRSNSANGGGGRGRRESGNGQIENERSNGNSCAYNGSSEAETRMSEDMANMKLLNEDDAEKYALDFTSSGLFELGSDLVQCSGLVEFGGEFAGDIAQCLY